MIQHFGSSITVNSNPLSDKDGAGWLSVVLGNLLTIDRTKTGKCLFKELHRTHKKFSVRPWVSSDVNADTAPENADANPQAWRDGYFKSRPFRGGDGTKFPAIGYGTGKGGDVHIRYTPWRFPANDQAVTLLHEFVHGIKYARGVEYCNPLPWGFTTSADFDTVLVEDFYRSECHFMLRKNHEGWQPLTGKLIPQPSAYKHCLASFKARMPAFVADLANLEVPFNPYRPGAQGYVKL